MWLGEGLAGARMVVGGFRRKGLGAGVRVRGAVRVGCEGEGGGGGSARDTAHQFPADHKVGDCWNIPLSPAC